MILRSPSLTLRLADNKYLLGRRISEWTNRAPALEAAVAAAAMTQDELGHARSLYAALHITPDAPEAYLIDSNRAQELGAPIVVQPFQHWAEFVAAVGLFDRAMTMVFEALQNSNHEALRPRSAKILQEEWFHRQYGHGWLRRLAAEPQTRTAMQSAVNHFWQPTADWLAAVQEECTAEGVLIESADDPRRRWLDETGALLTECSLTIQ
jgi:ring-1,2-phenylacetyl-CoA epoxidase subunit PaaC